MSLLDVADFPHLDAKGRDATVQRLWRRAGLLEGAAGATEGAAGERYDEHGRMIIDSAEGFMAWARQAGLTGVVAA